MTVEHLAAPIEALIGTALDAGLDDETSADVLQVAADALHEGL